MITHPPPKYGSVSKALPKKRNEDTDSTCINKSEEHIENDIQPKKAEKSSFLKSQEKSFLRPRRENSDCD